MQVCSKIVHKYTLLAVFLFRLRAWCPLCRQIKRFKRVLLFGCVTIHQVMQKSFCVRTHIAKTGYLPAEYIRGIFSTRTPSPFCAGSSWGLLSRKIFYFFFRLSFYARLITIWVYFISLRITASIWFLDFIFPILNSYSYFNFYFFYFLDSFLLLKFYSHQFRLVSALSILCFNSSTLYLFNSSACYKQTSMLIQVCFMFVLAILRLSDVFLLVLGVVYRLGIK